jgi:hypothetical protein
MSGRSLPLAISVIGAMLVCSPSALARRPPGARSERGAKASAKTPGAKTPIDEFERMSPEQQQRALERLPPAQRQKLQERLQRFNQLPREQQQTLRNLYNRLHELPANQQESVRKAINRFSEQAPDRQRAMRDELRSMAVLSRQDRDARTESREFRNSFSRREQGIVRDMLPVLPGHR